MFIATSGPTNTSGRRVSSLWLPSAVGAFCLLSLAAHAQPADRGARKPSQPVVAAVPIVPPDRSERISVFVELSLQHDAVGRPALRAWVAQCGARVEHEYTILPQVINVRDISRSDAERLRTLPGVLAITEDFPVTIMLNDSVEQIRGTHGQINAAGHVATGAGVRVCIVDTGIDSNSVMYASRIDVAAGYDFFNNDPNPEDDHGHGSHVAGILLGSIDTAADVGCGEMESFAGVAPAATLIGVKGLNFNGAGLASHLVAAINHCASPSLSGGPAQVINISAGGGQFAATCDTNLVAAAANNAVAAGLVVIAAAGNSNLPSALSAPACGSQVISVGATYDRAYPNCQFPTQDFFSFCVTPTSGGGCLQTCVDHFPTADQRCCFSNRSAILDVTAPGCNIFSNDFASPNGTGLKGFCGTSQATPHVAGLAALIRGFNPYLTPTEVRTIIRAGAIDLGATGYDSSYGHGRIDVINSLILAAPECAFDLDCADGLFCDGIELCIQGKCVAGAAPLCDDNIPCTIDDCDVVLDSCRFTPQNALCDNGLFCDGNENCDPILGCQPGFDPCGGFFCDEPSDTCGTCVTDADCDDFITCTVDSCDVATGFCSNLPNDANCDNGLFCDGFETCDALLDCQAAVPVDCDDAVLCTSDACNEETDTCDHIPNDALCDNGFFCDGVEACSTALGCQTGAPISCNDDVACTIDLCDEDVAGCFFIPDDTLCDNTLFCDGLESCDSTSGCQPGIPPCSATETCNDFADLCRPLPGAIWMSFVNSTVVPGLGMVENEDVVAYDLISGGWSWILDGSDVGMSNFAIDALAVLPSGDLLLSFRNPMIRIPGMMEGPGGGDRVDDSDIVRFHPTSLGDDSSGAFIFYFDGSDVGLTANEHNVDGLAITAEGFLILSTTGLFTNGKHVWTGNDLFRFIPTFLGPFTIGQFIPYFGGISVGLGDDPGENLDGAGLLPGGGLLLSTSGPFSIASGSGTSHDVLEFSPSATRPGGVPNLQLMLQPGASLGASAELSAIEYVP